MRSCLKTVDPVSPVSPESPVSPVSRSAFSSFWSLSSSWIGGHCDPNHNIIQFSFAERRGILQPVKLEWNCCYHRWTQCIDRPHTQLPCLDECCKCKKILSLLVRLSTRHMPLCIQYLQIQVSLMLWTLMVLLAHFKLPGWHAMLFVEQQDVYFPSHLPLLSTH